jgi:lambdaSa04 family prophage resolvase
VVPGGEEGADFSQKLILLLRQHGIILAEITDLQNRLNAYQHYKLNIAELDPSKIEFTPYLWHTFTDHAEVAADGTITFIFRDGSATGLKMGNLTSRKYVRRAAIP